VYYWFRGGHLEFMQITHISDFAAAIWNLCKLRILRISADFGYAILVVFLSVKQQKKILLQFVVGHALL